MIVCWSTLYCYISFLLISAACYCCLLMITSSISISCQWRSSCCWLIFVVRWCLFFSVWPHLGCVSASSWSGGELTCCWNLFITWITFWHIKSVDCCWFYWLLMVMLLCQPASCPVVSLWAQSVCVDALLLTAGDQPGHKLLQNLSLHLAGLQNLLMVNLLLPAIVERHLQHIP